MRDLWLLLIPAGALGAFVALMWLFWLVVPDDPPAPGSLVCAPPLLMVVPGKCYYQ